MFVRFDRTAPFVFNINDDYTLQNNGTIDAINGDGVTAVNLSVDTGGEYKDYRTKPEGCATFSTIDRRRRAATLAAGRRHGIAGAVEKASARQTVNQAPQAVW